MRSLSPCVCPHPRTSRLAGHVWLGLSALESVAGRRAVEGVAVHDVALDQVIQVVDKLLLDLSSSTASAQLKNVCTVDMRC